jgi:hypothetical protein
MPCAREYHAAGQAGGTGDDGAMQRLWQVAGRAAGGSAGAMPGMRFALQAVRARAGRRGQASRPSSRQGEAAGPQAAVRRVLHRLGSLKSTQAWQHVDRVIDREKNRYTEPIIDAAGNLVRDVTEPLSQHRGHGAAKRRPANAPPSP